MKHCLNVHGVHLKRQNEPGTIAISSIKLHRPDFFITQLLRVMKLTGILFLAACLHLSAKGLGQKITLSEKNTSLAKVFDKIKQQSGYTFAYTESLLKKANEISIKVENVTLSEALDLCLVNQPFIYEIIEKTVVIKVRPMVTNDVDSSLFSDDIGRRSPSLTLPPVTGIVRGLDGQPIAGANIIVKGAKRGTTTNADGGFVIDANKGEIIIISSIGFLDQQRVIGENNLGLISLIISESKLDEVQIIAYGKTSQRLSTGNVSTIKSEEIQKQPVSDPLMALQGKIPGLYLSQSSGIPGASSIVKIRGQNSIANGNDPLYIIDGVPITASSLTTAALGGGALGSPGNGPGNGFSPFNNLNSADIESIDVLKDADATAIYGSRGANGVVLITTKKGKTGKTKFDLNAYTSVGKVASKLDMLNTSQYVEMRKEAYKNDGITTLPNNAYDLNGTWNITRNTDWQKVLIGGTAIYNNIQGSVSGGNSNTQFLLGGGYGNQTTVFPGNYSDKKSSIHFNLNHRSIDQRFETLFSINFINDNNIIPQADFTNFITLSPNAPALYNDKGNLNWENNTWENPLASSLRSTKAITDNLIGSLSLSYEIIKGLKIKGSLGYTQQEMNQSNQSPASSYRPPFDNNPDFRSNLIALTNIKTWIIEPQINYIKIIGQGKIDALIGSTFQENIQHSISQYGFGFSSDALIPNIAAAATFGLIGSNYTQYKYNAIFGRINYNLQDKYLINLTTRRDGSSRFGPGKQFGNFGAIGVGWIFSREEFMQKALPFLSFAKLRTSYGSTGNDQIPDYQYLSTYKPFSFPYQNLTGLYPTRISNPNYGWEKVNKLEGGLDLGFFNNRLLFSASYYRNRTVNQLVGFTIPSINGFTTIQANLPAILQNNGVEIEFNTINIKRKEFTWLSSFNISIPRNKLLRFPDLQSNPAYKNLYVLGKSLSVQKTLHYIGVDRANGRYTFEDINSDDQINNLDYQFLKEKIQNYFGGFQNSFSYKGFELNIFFQFVKQTGYNYLKSFQQPGVFNQNQPGIVMSRWQKPGDNSNIQQFSSVQTASAGTVGGAFANLVGNNYRSDAVISDASFVRLKNVSLSYQLPGIWQQKAHLRNLKLYVLGQNLLTITKYLGLDPETQSLSLPPLRMMSIGIQATL
jgi:TonB-dependent starch-binding outer membrane protein SusC